MGKVISLSNEGWRQNYRYAVYEHKLVTKDGLSYIRSFIVLKNQCGVIVRFTRLHNYTGAYNDRTVRPLSSDANARMHYICMMLNYILIENFDVYRILLRYGEESLPETVRFYREYIKEENLGNNLSAWRLLDFLLYHLSGEITEIDSEETGRLVDKLDQEATRAVSELYAGFNAWMQKKLGMSGWRYKFEYRKKREDIEAYTVRQFSSMAYCIFNEECWEREHLVEKACG